MKTLVDYIFEVSKQTAQNALNKANEDIKQLTNEFAESKFKDMNILAKLQKRARQVDVFTDYIENVNNEVINIFVGSVKKVLKKWDEGRKLSNGATFRPIFILTSGEQLTWGKRYGWSSDEFNRNIEDILDVTYLTVIGLNSDFKAEKKTVQKIGGDVSSIENVEKEYESINLELIDDLSKVLGLKYSTITPNRKNAKNPYNTSVITFDIDKKAIDINKAADILPGYMYTNVGPTKVDRSSGQDRRGHYQAIYKTAERKQQLN